MEMSYGGAIVLPRNYVVMDQEEMTYLEGGGWTFNNTYTGNEAWYKIGEFGISIGVSVAALVGCFVAATATAATVVGLIAGVAGMLASAISIIFNVYNIASALVYTIKYGGFRHSGVQVPVWPTINLGVVSRL